MLPYFGLAIGIITLAIALGKIIYESGKQASRLDSLELWRTNVRGDMHEISNKIASIETGITGIKTIIEERTERRSVPRQEVLR
jgi:hypothetical protein